VETNNQKPCPILEFLPNNGPLAVKKDGSRCPDADLMTVKQGKIEATGCKHVRIEIDQKLFCGKKK